MFRNRGFESRAFPTRFVLTAPRRRGRGFGIATAFVAGAVCLIAASAVYQQVLAEWPARTQRASNTSLPTSATLASVTLGRHDGSNNTRSIAPARAVDAQATAIAAPVPKPKQDIAVANPSPTSKEPEANAAQNAFALASTGDDGSRAAVALSQVDVPLPPVRPRPAKHQRRKAIEQDGESYVHLYDRVTADGRREPVYRRTRSVNRSALEDDFESGWQGYAPAERRGPFPFFGFFR